MVNARYKAGIASEDMQDLFAHLPVGTDAETRLFTSSEQWNTSPESRAYAHYMRRAWDEEELGARAILCVDGRPTVYFKNVSYHDPVAEANAQRALWNQGMATLLVISDPHQVRVYSAFVQPKANQNFPEEDLKDRQVGEALERAAFALELTEWMQRVETGQYYRDFAEKFEPDQAVDQTLLRNLSAASDELCEGQTGLDRPTAHALLGRILFVCYLCDREIIDADYFLEAIQVSGIKNLRELLQYFPSNAEARDNLYRLFASLQEDFHGSLLNEDLNTEQGLIQEPHISVLRHLLNGDEVASGQLSLFPLYNFKLIPIETISGIYESFISAEDVKEADEDLDETVENGEDEESTPLSGRNQSESGAFYTPRHLAEMAVDSATQGWDSLLNKRCLDPACGSGIFLVVLFNRMAEEWSSKHPKSNNVERALELRRLMMDNLCGVDVHQTACRITCFSLYLAFFDQLRPPDILELKAQLKSQGDKVLPLLLGTEEKGFVGQPAASRPVIFAANFFEPSSNLFGPGPLGCFDLVIGNPPWKGRKQKVDKVMLAWLWSQENPFIAEASRRRKAVEGAPVELLQKVPRKQKTSVFFPQKQSAIAFMWKVPTHLKPEGRACLVLPSRVFLSETNEFQLEWLKRFSLDRVIQLSDYRFILFENAIWPTTIVTFRSIPPKDGRQIIAYDTPKVERIDPRRAIIPILPDDQKQLTVGSVVTAAQQKRAAVVWKNQFWGTGRDQVLLNRLLRLPPLSDIAGDPDAGKRWIKGQGFKPFQWKSYKKNPKTYGEPKERWWSDDALFIDAKSKNIKLFLLPSDCRPIKQEAKELYRNPDQRLFEPPMVLVNQGFSKFAFCDFPVLFRHALQSISGPVEDTDLLLFLSGVLNSALPTYVLFHTSANWGIERNEVHLDELLRLPFQLPDDTKNPSKSWEIVRNVANRIREAKQSILLRNETRLSSSDARQNAVEQAKEDISNWVFDYYNVTSRERVLVEDTANIFTKSVTPSSLDVKIRTLELSTKDQRAQYATWLCDTLNAWAHREPLRVSGHILTAPRLGLGLLILTKSKEVFSPLDREAPDEIQETIARIQRVLASENGRFSYLRGFTLFEKDTAYVLKPLNLRHWTRTAALNDADLLGAAMIN